MKGNELVWRTLLDDAVVGKRRWQSLADLAFASGVPLTTTHLATRKLVEVGSLRPIGGSGLAVINVFKLATIFMANRSIGRDVLGKTSRNSLAEFEQNGHRVVLGGPDAAVHHLGGENLVAGFSESIAYIEPASLEKLELKPDGEISVLPLDKRAALEWDKFASVAQTLADLFASPGWQAAEFFDVMFGKFVPERDWEDS